VGREGGRDGEKGLRARVVGTNLVIMIIKGLMSQEL